MNTTVKGTGLNNIMPLLGIVASTGRLLLLPLLLYGGAAAGNGYAEDTSSIVSNPNVVGVSVEIAAKGVAITWPSYPRESFVLLCRSNSTFKEAWSILTNQMPASPGQKTVFYDPTGLARAAMEKTNLTELYRVFVIPDFWFDMNGVTLNGDPEFGDEDFLPFYYGTRAEDIFKPEVGLSVDGEEGGYGTPEVQCVNFGTPQKPQWVYVFGFWFKHGYIADGKHTLQLCSTLALNNFVGDWSQSILLSNRPVRLKIAHKPNQNKTSKTWWKLRLGQDYAKVKHTEPEHLNETAEGGNLKEAHLPARPLDLFALKTNTVRSNMVLQLGLSTEFIQVTPSYSNAVMLAMLPIFSDFSQRLSLPGSHPILPRDVERCAVLPWQNKDGTVESSGVILKSGWSFGFQFGYVNSFESPHSYYGLQNPDEIPRFYGCVRMSGEEAVQLARGLITKLQIPLENVYADQEPQVTPPIKIGTNTVPYYLIQWTDPCGGHTRVEVNADARQVEGFSCHSVNLHRPGPKISILPPKGSGMFDAQLPSGHINPQYAWKLIPIIFKAVDDYAYKLSLPIPLPLTTNNVALVEVHDNRGWPHCEIVLTNGWRFIFRHNMVNGYYAPDCLFGNDCHAARLQDLVGKQKISTAEAIGLVKQTVVKLGYHTNNIHLDFAPNTIRLGEAFRKTIPRYFLEWEYAPQEELRSKIEAEVDAGRGELKSFYYDDTAYWNEVPLIDVPISTEN